MTQVLEVTTTAPTQAAAHRLAESAVCAGLAAGARVTGPVASYTWQGGECVHGEEWTVALRTVPSRYPDLQSHLVAEHESANPPIAAVPMSHATPAYADSVARATLRRSPERVQVSVAAEAPGDGFEPF